MRIFVTGGTGFIGSHFLQTALAAGHDVVALRRIGSQPRIVLDKGPVWLDKTLNAVKAKDLKEVSALVHFAAVGVSPQRASWRGCLHGNVLQQTRLIEKAADAGCERIVLCGSCVEYGKAAERYDEIPPDAPLEPIGAYATSKAAGAIAALALARTRNLKMFYLRVFIAYGEGQHESNFWPSLRTAALAGLDFPMTEGTQVRDFVSVEDVAASFLRAVEMRPVIPGQPVVENIGSGIALELREFAHQWWRRWRASGQLKPGTIPRRPREIMRYVPELPKYRITK